ncbi:phytanoyl-CoA dioxygenase [Flavobacterium davisii]|uniref:Phytanoyl-CoA dioxygenase n=2 Tax=Flavobacterium davisii TaxID=2906077 RepID=A0A246GG28_9FLAO|nr:phytanoyl-CoA dioxygenase [Flavobacterium davisii]
MNTSFNKNGFHILNNIYTHEEIETIIHLIESSEKSNTNFRKDKELFAIRAILKEIPKLKNHIFNKNLINIIEEIGNNTYFVIKSIYFDKPKTSNWVVPYHQDLTINLSEKIETDKFINWTKKNEQITVQPPTPILENIFTIRIHLDNTTAENGAVKVIPKSHKKGIIQLTDHEINKNKEYICDVPKGGVMLMKPLTLHASTRTTNNQRRRVIHIEFSNIILDNGLKWNEYLAF